MSHMLNSSLCLSKYLDYGTVNDCMHLTLCTEIESEVIKRVSKFMHPSEVAPPVLW